MKKKDTKQIVRNHYSKIATKDKSCCSCGCTKTLDSEQISKAIGYSDDEMKTVPDANLGLGCGN